MTNYLSVEHKFNVGDKVKFDYTSGQILSVLAEKFTVESYGYIDVVYRVRIHSRIVKVREIELEEIKKEEANETLETTNSNQSTDSNQF